jgi:hypothetical protein
MITAPFPNVSEMDGFLPLWMPEAGSGIIFEAYHFLTVGEYRRSFL